MRTVRIFIIVLAAILFLSGPQSLGAQEDDLFAFIPDGGKTLLERAIADGLSSEQLSQITAKKRTFDEWLTYLQEQKKKEPALQTFNEGQLRTLANYLAFNMPLSADVAAGNGLPRDAKEIALQYCQFCHIITVVVTQDRTREHWLGSMNKPSHIEIALTDRERETLADYLVLNGGIPIDLVPEELRAGGASY